MFVASRGSIYHIKSPSLSFLLPSSAIMLWSGNFFFIELNKKASDSLSILLLFFLIGVNLSISNERSEISIGLFLSVINEFLLIFSFFSSSSSIIVSGFIDSILISVFSLILLFWLFSSFRRVSFSVLFFIVSGLLIIKFFVFSYGMSLNYSCPAFFEP